MTRKPVWYLLLALSAAAAGAIYPFTKLLAVNFTPLSLSFFRYFIALFPMLPFFIVEMKRRKLRPGAKAIAALSGLGILGVTGFALLFFYGVVFSTGTNGSVLVNTQPIFAVLLTPVLIGESFSPKNLAGASIGIFGIVLVITGGDFSALRFSSRFFTGNLLLLGASIVLSVYSILLKPYVVSYGGTIPTFLTFTAGTIALAAVVKSVQGYIIVPEQITVQSGVFLLIIGFFSTAMMYIVFNRALQTIGTVESIGFKLLIPVFGILLSILVLKERPPLASYFGAGVVIASIFVIQMRSKQGINKN